MQRKKIATISIIVATVILAGITVFTATRLYNLRQESVSPAAPESRPEAAGQQCGGITAAGCPNGETCIYGNGTNIASFPDESGTCQPSERRTDTQSCNITFTLASGPVCYEACTTTSECPTDYECQDVGGVNLCVNPTCPTEADCTCDETVYSCNSDCTEDTQCQTADSGYVCDITTSKCRRDDNLDSETCEPPSTSTPTVTATPTSTATATPSDKPEIPDAGVSLPTLLSAGFGIIAIVFSLLLIF